MGISISSRNIDYIYQQIVLYTRMLGILEINTKKILNEKERALILELVDFNLAELKNEILQRNSFFQRIYNVNQLDHDDWFFEITALNKRFKKFESALIHLKEDQIAAHIIILKKRLKSVSLALFAEKNARNIYWKNYQINEEKKEENLVSDENRFYEKRIISVLRILVNNRLFASKKIKQPFESAFWLSLYNDIKNDSSYQTLVNLKNEYDSFIDLTLRIKNASAALLPSWSKRHWKPILFWTVVAVAVATTVLLLGPTGIGLVSLVGLSTLAKASSVGGSLACCALFPAVFYGVKKVVNFFKNAKKTENSKSNSVLSPLAKNHRSKISRNSLSFNNSYSRSCSTLINSPSQSKIDFQMEFNNPDNLDNSDMNKTLIENVPVIPIQQTQYRGIRSRL